MNLLLLQYYILENNRSCEHNFGRKKKEISESIIGRFWSIIDSSLTVMQVVDFMCGQTSSPASCLVPHQRFVEINVSSTCNRVLKLKL